jgi:hypothetical protein
MADLAYRTEIARPPVGSVAWGAIWAGMFTFVAIWSVFGVLGEAIFASSNANGFQPANGISVGLEIWMTILTIIAMYVAGRVTAHFTGALDRGSSVMHGIAMFGLSVVAVVMTMILGTSAMVGSSGVAAGPRAHVMLFSGMGWFVFACLLLGWLAAIGGAAHHSFPKPGVARKDNVQDMRPAA